MGAEGDPPAKKALAAHTRASGTAAEGTTAMDGAVAMEEVGQTGDETPAAEELAAAAGQEGGAIEASPLTITPGPRGRTPYKPCCCDGGDKCLVKDHGVATDEEPHPCKRTAGDRKTCQPCRKGRNRKRRKADDDPAGKPAPAGKRGAPLAAAADTLARLSEGEPLNAQSAVAVEFDIAHRSLVSESF